MTSLASFLSQWAHRGEDRRAVAATIEALADASRLIADLVSDGPLNGNLAAAVEENVQGEVQKALDRITNDRLIEACRAAPVAAIASEELDHPVLGTPGAPLLVAIDPLDGSSNIDTNVSIGTIFSILPAPEQVDPRSHAAFLQKGRNQLAAGYILYGPQTNLVLTVGEGTQIFTLDRRRGDYVLTARHVKIPEKTREFAINASNSRHWDEPIKAYVAECQAGQDGGRGEDTNMRWVGSLVADGHRILIRGGVYLYPSDQRSGYRQGRLRLLYECNPLAFIVEQAGGGATTGDMAVLDVEPAKLHQRVAFIFGSSHEVARIEDHHVGPEYVEAHRRRRASA
ncbi:MAG: class 1 fructose-bisphosphatase [Ancalomicrobiaceae bacterium]|nr:class 1 fructose-bisphosphatase [Ancalomicrobiaceae bacterium]